MNGGRMSEPVTVKLIREWMGYPADSILDVWKHIADYLITTQAAVLFDREKGMKKPPKDKMVKTTENKRFFARVSDA